MGNVRHIAALKDGSSADCQQVERVMQQLRKLAKTNQWALLVLARKCRMASFHVMEETKGILQNHELLQGQGDLDPRVGRIIRSATSDPDSSPNITLWSPYARV